MGTMMLFYPYIALAGSGGWSGGEVPMQRSFAFEAPLSRIVTPYSFRTVRPNEFTGDNFYTLSCEYNLREIPFLAFGLTTIHIDLILRAAVGNIWTHSAGLKLLTNPLSTNYDEYTIGLGRVADMFRFDLSLAPGKHQRFSINLLGSM